MKMRMPCQSCNGTLIAARSHKQESSAKFQSHVGSLAVRNASRAWSEKGIWGDWFDIFEVVIATSGSAATATTTTTIVGSSLHNGVGICCCSCWSSGGSRGSSRHCRCHGGMPSGMGQPRKCVHEIALGEWLFGLAVT